MLENFEMGEGHTFSLSHYGREWKEGMKFILTQQILILSFVYLTLYSVQVRIHVLFHKIKSSSIRYVISERI